MAFITKKNATEKCYSCSKHCINIAFCSSSNTSNASLGEAALAYTFTRNMRVNIIANPDFWGFGTKATNVLISGWATWGESNYDFFDGYDKDHEAEKDCGVGGGFFADEQRPDVVFRSVYDPDTGKAVHYGESGNIEATGGAGLGGAEVYLINRSGGLYYPISGDQPSCDVNPPHQSFRIFPENFGWGNKINFNSDIFRNISGGWRLTSVENCYGNNIYKPSGYLLQCSGNDGISKEKQNITYYHNRYKNYDKNTRKGYGTSLFPDYNTECRPDGAVAGKYSGRFYSINSLYRNVADSPFIQARLSYGPSLAASGLKNGMAIGIKTEQSGVVFDNVYTVFDVSHAATYTSVKLVGTSSGNRPLVPEMPTGDFIFNIETNSDSGHWVAFNTLDPQTCCGLAAYGVSDEHKQISNPKNYHTDFRRVFNNPKNIRQSNRESQWRFNYGGVFPTGIDIISSGVRLDYSYPSVSGVEISGKILAYPVIVSGDSHVVTTGSGDLIIESGYGLYEREKPYYGFFAETEKCDTAERLDTQRINRGKGNNGTCYSKQATLEIFPDCYTQYDKFEHCNYGETYAINRLARLAFVYRGCDFNDDCSFDSYGRPLGAWSNQGGEPQNINDLRRLLAGQEIHMFINLNNAWGGRHNNQPCTCDCNDENSVGYATPKHVEVRSPMRFPGFPNFDYNPVKYGCKDARHQIQSIINLELLNTPEPSEYCDPLHTSANVCRVRQPYTTYGAMFNLCGKEKHNRREVIEAFNKRHQLKTYTNNNYTSDLVEPMYWSVTAPGPSPYGNQYWSSGTLALDNDTEDASGVPFNQQAGYNYGFWGLADHYGNLVAPYFCTQKATQLCCGTEATNVDFSVTGTFQNLLNTDTGWPTDAVPFLIELEVEEGCSNCASTVMEDTNLTIEINGLPGEFIWDARTNYFLEYGQYGHNYCKYGKPSEVEKWKYGFRPPFSCTTGFDLGTCNGSGGAAGATWASYTGNTCSCADGFTTTLYPKKVPDSDLVLGFTSNPVGDAAGLVEITNCGDLASTYFSVGYDGRVIGGYKIFAQFDLACGIHTALPPAEYPDVKYENDPLAVIWGGGTCGHKYPAGDSDMTLQTTLWMIDVAHESTFKLLSPYGLKRISGMNLGNGILYPPSPQNFYGDQETNYFGLCDGDYVYTWGCKPAGTYFYGEADDEGRYPGSYAACTGATPCNTCATSGPDAINCICGVQAGYKGVIPHPMPIKKQLNECDCLCETPYLLAKYQIKSGYPEGLDLVDDYGNDTSLATAYWMSFGSNDPILIVQGPPDPYMGIRLKYGGGQPANWHSWSHGVNGLQYGITHELYRPYRGRDFLLAGTECTQLTVDHQRQPGWVPSCEPNTNCTLDYRSSSGTCGVHIYGTGINFANIGYPVRKKKCAPEVAIVTKIEKIGSLFKLHVSREFHEHDRTWYEQRVVGTGDEAEMMCVPLNQGAYEYNDGSESGCYLMPYANFADTLTPVENAPCSIHPSSGVFVNQDYQHTATGLTYGTGLIPSGSHTWNYYNLFYKDGFEPIVNYGDIKDSTYFNEEKGTWHCTGVPELLLQEIDGKTIYSQSAYSVLNGIFATRGQHSCVQDSSDCGGDLWCNKLFFPRHNYRAGTLIAPFGAHQICTGSMNRRLDLQYNGYYEATYLDKYGVPGSELIDSSVDLLTEARDRFVDVCNSYILQQSAYNIGIDDNYLYVSDYLPLMGVIHPGWRYTTDMRSCTVANSGKLENIQYHTEQSISAGIFGPRTYDINNFNSMGFYLDTHSVSYSGVRDSEYVLKRAHWYDQCLFSPFKIMIDVECNTNRIRRRDVIGDSPTLLQGVDTWDARTCHGLIGPPGCSCGNTQCKYSTQSRVGSCVEYELAEYQIEIGELSGVPCVQSETPVTQWYHPNVLSSASVPGIRCSDGGVYNPGLNHKTSSCTGSIFRMSNTKSIVKQWQCNQNQYLHDHPGAFIVFRTGVCDCQSQYQEGLCNAKHSCSDYSTCDCNPIPSGYISVTYPLGHPSGSGQWWATDCECHQSPMDEASDYCTPSLIKWTITEA